MTPHPADLDERDLLAQCRMTRGRTSGPGGQHRNKVETAITLHHEPTGLRAQAGERRKAEDNKRVALTRLRLLLAMQERSERSEIPSPLWTSRSRGGKMSINPKHADFPSILAEALDVLAAHGWEPRPAAELLGVSSSQLVKLVKLHPAAFTAWNQRRAEAGLRPLR